MSAAKPGSAGAKPAQAQAAKGRAPAPKGVPGAAPGAGKAGRAVRRSGRGALFVIAAMFALSGTIRLGEGALAFASASETGAQGAAEVPAACSAAPDSAALLAALKEREARLATREAELQDRSQAVALASGQIDRKLADLVAAEERLAATMARADTAADSDVARLTAMYEAMKPKEAAPLFEAMAPDFAAGFLARMRPEAAGPVLAALPPETAYAISAILAGRNAAAPRH